MTIDGLQTRFWLATPAGTAAIAVTVVDGPAANELISKFFRSIHNSNALSVPVGGFRYGRWHSGNNSLPRLASAGTAPAGEDLLVCRTGREQFEIHSHGGRIATSRIADDLQKLGAQPTTWQDHLLATQPWYQARPQIAYQQASTLRTASLLDQQRVNWIRFARETGTLADDPVALIAKMTRMLEWEAFGMHLLRPRKVVLFGPPNVGKSSLMNRLGGFGRSIIHDMPGTTRDVVSLATVIDGWPVEILDTAGMRDGLDDIERQGIEFARNAVSSAALRLLVLDSASVPCDAELESLMALQPDFVIGNKLDLAGPDISHLPSPVCVSALTGEGMPELITRIGGSLVGEFPESELPISLDEEMSARLREAIGLANGQNWSALQRMFFGDVDPMANP